MFAGDGLKSPNLNIARPNRQKLLGIFRTDTMAMKTTKPKVLSSTEMTKRAQAFVAKYKNEISERAASQTW